MSLLLECPINNDNIEFKNPFFTLPSKLKYSDQVESLVDLSPNFQRSTIFRTWSNSAISKFSLDLCL